MHDAEPPDDLEKEGGEVQWGPVEEGDGGEVDPGVAGVVAVAIVVVVGPESFCEAGVEEVVGVGVKREEELEIARVVHSLIPLSFSFTSSSTRRLCRGDESLDDEEDVSNSEEEDSDSKSKLRRGGGM